MGAVPRLRGGGCTGLRVDDEVNLPDDGVCPTCDGLKRDNAGVEKLLAARGLKEGIRYCRCQRFRYFAFHELQPVEQELNTP